MAIHNPVTPVTSGVNPVTLTNMYDADTIGVGGRYETVSDYITYLATQDVVTAETLTGGPYTVTINDNEDIVTLSADADLHNTVAANGKIIKQGAWSPDGTEWYRIKQVLDDDRFRLFVPYSGSNLSGGTLYLGTPIWRDIILNPGDYQDDADFLLDFSSLDAVFAKVTGINTPKIGTNPGSTYAINMPKSGVLWVDNIDVSGTGYNIPFLATSSVAEARLSRITGNTYGVDIALGDIGSFRADRCTFSSSNDGITLKARSGPTEWYDCDLAVYGVPIDLVGNPFYFAVRLFFSSDNGPSHRCYSCKLTASTIDGAASPGKGAYIVDSGKTMTVELNDCEIFVAGYTGTTTAVIGPFSAGTTMDCDVQLNNCNIRGEATSGSPTVITAATWASSPGGVEIHWCNYNGLAEGGGGDQPTASDYNVA